MGDLSMLLQGVCTPGSGHGAGGEGLQGGKDPLPGLRCTVGVAGTQAPPQHRRLGQQGVYGTLFQNTQSGKRQGPPGTAPPLPPGTSPDGSLTARGVSQSQA